jgi:hypothetical protein
MMKFKKLFFVAFLVTSLSNFNLQAMEKTWEHIIYIAPDNDLYEFVEKNDDETQPIQREWSPDGKYLYITINGVIFTYGPFPSDSDETEENQTDSDIIAKEPRA